MVRSSSTITDWRQPEVGLSHMIRGADRLRRGECGIDCSRGRKKGRIHNEQIVMIERPEEFVESRIGGIASKAHSAALMGNREASHVLHHVEPTSPP